MKPNIYYTWLCGFLSVLLQFDATIFYASPMLSDTLPNTCWHWQNPRPQGRNLNDVCHINETTAWTVGDRGTILKTTDGGQTWFSKSFDTINYRQVVFQDSLHGWLLGNNGTTTILTRTTDSGESWEHIILPTYFLHIIFISNTKGFAVAGTSVLYTTNDGGLTWTAMNLGNEVSLISIFFLDEQYGWIGTASNSVLRTLNGGADWLPHPFPIHTFPFTNLRFFSPTLGYGRQNEYLMKTTDGGINWSRIATLPQNHFIHFSDSLVGYASFSANTYPSNSSMGFTTNGGYSWQYVEAASESTVRAISTFGNFYCAVGDNGLILNLADITKRENTNMAGEGVALYNLTFIDSLHGWASTLRGNLLYTNNGGVSWQYLRTEYSIINEGLQFINQNKGWALTYDGLMTTNNAGIDWQFTQNNTAESIDKFQFLTTETGWAIINEDILAFTSDGGNTWIPSSLITQNDIESFYFITQQKGWVVTESGNVYTTTNAGIDWNIQHISDNGLKNIQFVNENTGWVVSIDNYLYNTQNGGNTWQLINAAGLYFTHLKFIDSQNGWAVTIGGKVYRTYDGGVNWMEDFYPKNMTITDLTVVDTLHCWLAANGTILKRGAPPKPTVQDYVLCQHSQPTALSAEGANIRWYTTPEGGEGSTMPPTPDTSVPDTLTYYVSQSPMGIGDCQESERAVLRVYIVPVPNGTLPLVATIGNLQLNCDTLHVADATAMAMGGVPPYSYAWSNGQTTQQAAIAEGGDYLLTITDALGCSDTQSFTVPVYTGLQANFYPLATPCSGKETRGSIGGVIYEGMGPISFMWSTGATTSQPYLENLTTGEYSVTVQSGNGCKHIQPITLGFDTLAPVVLSTLYYPLWQECYASVTVPDWAYPVAYYRWSNGATTSYLSDIPQGEFSVTVVDTRGCFVVVTDNCMDPSSTHEEDIWKSLGLSPNPANNQVAITISFENPADATLTIYNQWGQNLWQETTNNIAYYKSLDVSAWAAGNYIFAVQTSQGVSRRKLSILR